MHVEIMFEAVEDVRVQLLLGTAHVLEPHLVKCQFLTYSIDVLEGPA